MIYGFKCDVCGKTEDVSRTVADRNTPFLCSQDSCEGTMCRGFDATGIDFVLKGYGWASKDGREKKYREKRSDEMGRKMHDSHPRSKMLPNYKGKQTGTWKEAQQLAKKDGKNSRSYTNKVKQEQAGAI